MIINFVEAVYAFNKKAGLLDKPYDDFLESSFQIEEALEGFEAPARDLTLSFENPKHTSRSIVSWMQRDSEVDFKLSDVDRLDKACDAIVYALGSMSKLGLKPSDINEALMIVANKNLEKLDCPKDEFGKLTKPEGFVGPEAELQVILNRITDIKKLSTYKSIKVTPVNPEDTTIMLNSTYGITAIIVYNLVCDVNEYFISMLEKDSRVLSIEVM